MRAQCPMRARCDSAADGISAHMSRNQHLEDRHKTEGTRGGLVQDTPQDSVPGVLACIRHAGPERQLHATPAHGALQVGDGERKTGP